MRSSPTPQTAGTAIPIMCGSTRRRWPRSTWPNGAPDGCRASSPPTEVAQRAFDPGQAGFAETGFAPVEAIPAKPPVDRIVISQDVTAVLAAKRAALEAHRTQVSVSGAFFALSNGVGQRIGDHEY